MAAPLPRQGSRRGTPTRAARISRRPPRTSANGHRRPRAASLRRGLFRSEEVNLPSPSRPRLVVAEDQALIRLDLERLLDEAGFEVCGAARDGQEAVELALELRPDLVVLDVKMPRLDGVEAARRILAERFVPIVMLTAYGYGELISRAVEVGVVGFVVKPFKESVLVEALREALAKSPDPASLTYFGRAPRD